jgi:nitroimidazol reductase NimA-like FMN-containing flavoprotein (pyridoxamine 5'-phosphate oxidase superfamily)
VASAIEPFPATPRTTLRRKPERGSHDRQVIEQILDEAIFCHVGFVVDGQPYVIPTLHARVGSSLYLHGAKGNRMLRHLADGSAACVTVTLLDGLVLARSARRHSVNYRSVVVLGTAAEVTEPREKLAVLEAVVEHVVPGRWRDVRVPSEQELAATRVLRLSIDEASAKVRSGPPLDDEADLGLGCWAGEVPLGLAAEKPIADPRLRDPALAPPSYAVEYRRPRRGAAR